VHTGRRTGTAVSVIMNNFRWAALTVRARDAENFDYKAGFQSNAMHTANAKKVRNKRYGIISLRQLRCIGPYCLRCIGWKLHLREKIIPPLLLLPLLHFHMLRLSILHSRQLSQQILHSSEQKRWSVSQMPDSSLLLMMFDSVIFQTIIVQT